MKKQLIIICSQFYKDLTQGLYQEAYKGCIQYLIEKICEQATCQNKQHEELKHMLQTLTDHSKNTKLSSCILKKIQTHQTHTSILDKNMFYAWWDQLDDKISQGASLINQLLKVFTSLNKTNKQQQALQHWDGTIKTYYLDGSGEIPLLSKQLLKKSSTFAVLALGVLIKGETKSYDVLCNFLQTALWDLQKQHDTPVLFSVLMLNSKEQAQQRLCKGSGSMQALMRMIQLQHEINIC